MATHYIQMDVDETESQAVASAGTSLSYSSGYGKDVTLSWDSGTTNSSLIYDAVSRIIEYMEHYNSTADGDVSVADNPAGWRTSLPYKPGTFGDEGGFGVDYRAGEGDTNSILDGGGAVAIEIDASGANIPHRRYIDTARKLQSAFAQLNFPLA